MQKLLNILLVVLALVLIGVILYPQYQLSRPTQLRIGCDRSVVSLPIFLAQADSIPAAGGWEPGYFAQQQVIIELAYYDDPEEVLKDLRAGSVDCAVLPWFHILKALDEGETLKVFISSEFRGTVPVDAIFVKKGSRVRQISDLEGRRVGVMPQLSDLSSVLFKAAGVEGVKLLELRPEALISSLLEGKMDAVILLEPYRTEAIGRGAEVLCDAPLSRRVQSPFPGVGICTRGSFIEKEHRAGVRLHNALELSVGYIDRQPTQAREILAQALKTPKAKFEHILLPEFQRLSRIDQAAVQTFANRLASLEFLSPGLDSRLLLADASQLR